MSENTKRINMNRFAIIATALLVGCVSCGKVEGNTPDEEEPIDNSSLGIELSTKAEAIVRQGNSFAIRFLSQVDAVSEGDYIISPLSMQFLLGMILNGAQGTTADQICQVLGYGTGEVEAMNEFALSILEQLPFLDKSVTLNIANAVVVNQNYPILDSYKTAVTTNYEAEVSNRDFRNSATLRDINRWANDRTNGLIPKILDELDPIALAYLMNAIYFKGQWTVPFSKDNTSKEHFTKEDGKLIDVQMMKREGENIGYLENDRFRAVNLTYGESTAFSMTILLPSEGFTLADIIAALGEKDWNESIHSMKTGRTVNLWLPKFETTSHFTLNGILSEMGMPLAFDSAADFRAMSDYALCLSAVLQDSVIKVDEEGTEATSISIGVITTSYVPPVDFHADRPFLYLVSESSTGAILFAGKFTGNE